jgi:hypothetical protein
LFYSPQHSWGFKPSIKANIPHDDVSLSGAHADWKDILAVYAVKTATDPAGGWDVATMDESKKALLQSVFWDMNTITYQTAGVTETKVTITDDGAGHPVGTEKSITKTVLYITVTDKTAAEAAEQYGFTDAQKTRFAELLSDEYADLWVSVLHGIRDGNADVVAAAVSRSSVNHPSRTARSTAPQPT